jgi:hypothetical protein
MDILKEEQDSEALLEEIMDTRVNIRLQDIITSSESLMKLMFRNLPVQKQGENNIPVAKVGAISLLKPERAYAAATPRIRAKIGDLITEALLDTGAEVNVMTRALANRTNCHEDQLQNRHGIGIYEYATERLIIKRRNIWILVCVLFF